MQAYSPVSVLLRVAPSLLSQPPSFSFKLAEHRKCNTISWKKIDDYIIDHKLLTHVDLLHNPIQLSEDLTRHFVSKYKACIFSYFAWQEIK